MPKKFFDIVPPEEKEFFQEEIPEKRPPLKEVFEPEAKELIGKKAKPGKVFGRGLVFCLIFLILLGFFGYSLFAKTEIEIWPKGETLTFKERINIDPELEESDFQAKVIPGKVFEDQKFRTDEVPSSGKTIKKEKARGIIRVYNTYSTADQPLLSGTRFVSTDGKLFKSLKREVIPGGRYEKGKLVPGEIDIKVEAAEPGEDYNIGTSTFSIPGFAGTSRYTAFYGKSFSPMEGGFIGEVAEISEEDLEKAQAALAERLKKESSDFLKSVIPAGFVLLDEAVSQEIIESETSSEPGEKADSFFLSIKAESNGLAFRQSDIEVFAKGFIGSDIPPDKEIQEESLEVKYLDSWLEEEKLVLNLEIKAKIYPILDLTALKKALLGRSLGEVRMFLENLDQITEIEISPRPFWKKKLPEEFEKVEIKLNLGVD